MLTPEQSRAYEELSVGAVNEMGYLRASCRDSSVDSRGFDESCDLQETEVQTSNAGKLLEEIRSSLPR